MERSARVGPGDFLQEVEELLVAVTLVAGVGDPAGGDLEGRAAHAAAGADDERGLAHAAAGGTQAAVGGAEGAVQDGGLVGGHPGGDGVDRRLGRQQV